MEGYSLLTLLSAAFRLIKVVTTNLLFDACYCCVFPAITTFSIPALTFINCARYVYNKQSETG